MTKIDINFFSSLDIRGGRTDLVVRFGYLSEVRTSEAQQKLVSFPTYTEVLREVARLKQERDITDTDVAIKTQLLQDAHRNLLRSPERGLLNVPRLVLQAIVESGELYRVQMRTSINTMEDLDNEVRIDFEMLRKMRKEEPDSLPLEGGAVLLKLGAVAKMKGFSTFGYYQPNGHKLVLIPVELGGLAFNALKQYHSNPHAPSRNAPR